MGNRPALIPARRNRGKPHHSGGEGGHDDEGEGKSRAERPSGGGRHSAHGTRGRVLSAFYNERSRTANRPVPEAIFSVPAIVFAHNKTLAAQLYSEFREFFPNNAVEYFVSYYDYYQPEAYVPQRDLFIEKDSAINEHIEQMRLSCTKSILERRDVVIVATVSAIYGIGQPEAYHKMVMTLRSGDKLNQRDAIAQLVRMQYQRNDMDFSRGTFRVRGDTIDIFPAEHSEMALRLEMFDDEIESLQLFDPLTGRIRQKIPRFTVYPGSHYVTPREQVLQAVETIKVELAERLKFFVSEGKLVEAQRLEQRTRFDLEMLSEVGHCKGIENYSRHLAGSAPGDPPSTLTDYMPKDSVMFIDESHVTIGQFGAMYLGDRSRKTTLVEYGFRLPRRSWTTPDRTVK